MMDSALQKTKVLTELGIGPFVLEKYCVFFVRCYIT